MCVPGFWRELISLVCGYLERIPYLPIYTITQNEYGWMRCILKGQPKKANCQTECILTIHIVLYYGESSFLNNMMAYASAGKHMTIYHSPTGFFPCTNITQNSCLKLAF
jgi:hypothetical protein